MKTIYKYNLEVHDEQTLSLPIGARVLSVANQYEKVVLYAMVNPGELGHEPWLITCRGTGHSINHNPGTFIGTVPLMGSRFMFHFFAKLYL